MIKSKADPISVTASPLRPSLPFSCNRGFSLIELLFVSLVLAALILVSVPAFSKVKDLARQARCMGEIRDLEKAIAVHSSERNGTFPTTWAELGMQPPLDPWDRAYVIGPPFRKDITFLNKDYDLYSTGADGLTAQEITDAQSLDDVLRAGDGGFVGLVDSILF